jgi:hypothetical protein
MSITLVGELIKLPDDLVSALGSVQFEFLQGRPKILYNAVAPGTPAPRIENMVSKS